MTALNILKRGALKPHQKVLIYGASGSVGSYAVQLAKYYFNAEVTGVCSTKNISMVKSLGADKIIDYKESDFTQGSTTYDVIFDAVGKLNAREVKIVLKTGGSFLTVKTMTKETAEDLNTLINLFEAGKIKVVMDSTYPLVQIADAYQKVETGHKIGNVVISIIPSEAEGEA